MGEREKGGRALDRFLRPELESRESLRPGFRGRRAPVGIVTLPPSDDES